MANGYQVVESVREVGSGVNDKREALTALLERDTLARLAREPRDGDELNDDGTESS